MAPLIPPGKGVIALMIALAPALCACASFGIYSPNRDFVVDGSTVSVDIKGGPNMSGLEVSLDGTDVTSSLGTTSGSEYTNSSLPVGGSAQLLRGRANEYQ